MMDRVYVDKLVLGPPGTGKTTTLLEIVDSRLSAGVPPERIAFLSFTRKAAEEARDRACVKFNFDKDQLPFFRTIHSLAYRILGVTTADLFSRDHARALGSALGINLSYIQTGYSEGTAVPVGGDYGSILLSLHSLSQVCMIPLYEAWQKFSDGLIPFNKLQHFSESYSEYKTSRNLLDFNDMLQNLSKLEDTRHFPVFDTLIVDEAQDLTRLQWAAFKKIAGKAATTIAAGDDDQSIYEWSGADLETFLNIEAMDTQVLNVSHRLNRGVYTRANKILENIHNRYPKPFNPSSEEEGTALNVVSIEELDLLDIEQRWLLLVRNKCFMEDVVNHCHMLSVPYTVVGGNSPINSVALQAIRDWESLRAGKKVTAAAVKSIYSLMRVGDQVARGHKFLPNTEDGDLLTMNELVMYHGLKTREPWFNALVRMGSSDIEYYRLLLKRKERLASRITISTIHGAKGGEEDNVAVFLDQAYRTNKAAQDNPDAEHRVFYVGFTRAKKRLFVVSAKSRCSYSA